ncbi:MAG: integrin alpha, partial [Pirellulaceae bacterium]
DADGLLDPGQDLRVTPGTAPQVRVRATNLTANPATLYAWIDYDSDGLFENGSERVSLAVPAGTNNGLFTLTFPTIPIATIAGTTYARFRLSSDLNAAEATGLAADGEVEDYVAKLFRPSVVSIDTSKTEKIAHQLNGGPALLNSDLFGISMAAIGDVDGDGIPDVAVGASGDDFGGTENTNRGAIYIQFMNADGTVRSSTKIASGLNGGPNLLANDAFGTAVAGLGDLDGDGVPDVAVGAVGDDTGGNNRGAIYTLFLRGDGSVKSSVEVASGLNNGPTLVDTSAFGASITSLGDMNGDGVPDLAVGATGANLNSGSVYTLFMNRNGTAVSSVQTISQALTPIGSLIGSAVASIGDLDNDGITDLAVGDRGYDTPLGDQGAVYIVRMNADGTPKTPLLTISSGVNGGPTLAGGNLFGQSVTSLGDLDGDGNTDIAVGASGDASGGTGRG